jgi:hypothetical protein
MSTEVTIILARLVNGDQGAPPKLQRSLDNALSYLNDSVDRALDALPPDRTLSFLETALFCTVTHLPFRQVTDVSRYERLTAFCARFGERDGACRTEYRFDAT